MPSSGFSGTDVRHSCFRAATSCDALFADEDVALDRAGREGLVAEIGVEPRELLPPDHGHRGVQGVEVSDLDTLGVDVLMPRRPRRRSLRFARGIEAARPRRVRLGSREPGPPEADAPTPSSQPVLREGRSP